MDRRSRTVELPYMFHEHSMIETMRSDMKKYEVTIEIVAFNGAAGWPTVRAYGTFENVRKFLSGEYGSNVTWGDKMEEGEFWRDHIDYTHGQFPTADWPDTGSDEYERVNEVAIGLIHAAGLECDEKDALGAEAGDILHWDLMDAQFRSPGLGKIFDHMDRILMLTATNAIDTFRKHA